MMQRFAATLLAGCLVLRGVADSWRMERVQQGLSYGFVVLGFRLVVKFPLILFKDSL